MAVGISTQNLIKSFFCLEVKLDMPAKIYLKSIDVAWEVHIFLLGEQVSEFTLSGNITISKQYNLRNRKKMTCTVVVKFEILEKTY